MPYITINLDTMEYRHSVGIPSEISTNEFYFEISDKEIEKVNNKIKKLKWDSSRCLNFLLKCFYSRLDTTYHVVCFYGDTHYVRTFSQLNKAKIENGKNAFLFEWLDALKNDTYNKEASCQFKRLKMAKRKIEEFDRLKQTFCLENYTFLIVPSAFINQFTQMVRQNFPELKDGHVTINDLPPNYSKSFLEAIKKRNNQIINLLINL